MEAMAKPPREETGPGERALDMNPVSFICSKSIKLPCDNNILFLNGTPQAVQ